MPPLLNLVYSFGRWKPKHHRLWQGSPWLCHIMVDGIIERLLMEERNGMVKTGSQSKAKGPFCFFCNNLLKKTEDILRTILVPTSDDVPYNSVTLHCPHLPRVPSSLKTSSRRSSFQQMNLLGPHPSHVQIMPIHILHIIYPLHVWFGTLINPTL